MRRAICPGSFDPVTFGHLDIIERAASLYDEVLVGIGLNGTKNAIFGVEARMRLMSEATAHVPNVRVVGIDGLLAQFCVEHEIEAIVKGIRSSTDFDYEMQMAQMNRQISDVETVFLPTAAQWAFVSSTLIRQIATLGGDIDEFVPACVVDALRERLTTEGEQ